MLVCMDANFRLKNHLVSNFSTDPGAWNGMAYMVPRSPYEAYVLSQADAEDVSYLQFVYPPLLIAKPDQYLCRIPGPREGNYSEHKGTSLHRRQRRNMWKERDDTAQCNG